MDEAAVIVGRKYRDAAGGFWRVTLIDGGRIDAEKATKTCTVTTGMSLDLFARLMVEEVK